MIELRIARWSAWMSGVETPEEWRAWLARPHCEPAAGAPSATELPPLLRRRCDALARTLLHVAGTCCDAALRSEVATVFASRQGPLAAVVENLETLAAGAPLSPTTFTHAVHNTQLGLFSIWARNRAPGSALAACEETFAHGFLEAALLALRTPARPVLLVAGDALSPEPLAALADPVRGAHALALLLTAEGPGERVRFGFSVAGALAADAGQPELPEPLAFLRWWLGEEPTLRRVSGGRMWSWERA